MNSSLASFGHDFDQRWWCPFCTPLVGTFAAIFILLKNSLDYNFLEITNWPLSFPITSPIRDVHGLKTKPNIGSCSVSKPFSLKSGFLA